MKLWLKQTLLALIIILVTVSACLYFFVALQVKNLLTSAQEGGEKNLNAFLQHLSTLDTTGTTPSDADEITKTVLIQYTFSTYAHILQNAESAYSLSKNGEYLYNISSINPIALLPLLETNISANRMTLVDGTPWLLLARNVEVLSMQFTVHYVQDISAAYDAIDYLTRAAQLALIGCLLLSGIILPLVLRRTLYPLRKLTQTSEQIASGQYALRSQLKTSDEVGELSTSFDRMAETVEQKILTLEDIAKRQELLLGALTHEMKTPMTAIIGFSDSLISMPLSEEGRMEAAHEIHEAALRTERLSQKMMQLISMTDCPVLIKRRQSTQVLFEQVARIISPQLAEKSITLQTENHIDYVIGDGDLLIALLTNLIGNAINASAPNTSITLSGHEHEGEACLQVTDEGVGIPKDKITLVTEPFYRVDKARSRKLGGAGLGLSLCLMIAQAHGGKLGIQSEPKKGTCICISLPMNE